MASLRTSSRPSYMYNNVHAFWRKKRVRLHKFPIRATGRNITQLSDDSRRENKHINHSRHHPHQVTRNRLTVRQILRLLQEVFPRNISATLHISSLIKNFKSFHRNKILTSSSLRFALFFHLFPFPLFSLFFFFFLSVLLFFLRYLSYLPSASCSRRSLLHA